MAAPKSQPTVRMRRLAGELRRLRVAANLSVDDVAKQIDVSRATLFRIEGGDHPPKLITVRALLDIYGVSDEVRADLEETARRAKEPGWWASELYGGDIGPQLAYYLSLEADATAIKRWVSTSIYGLLQTPAYATAIEEQIITPPAIVEARAKLRLARQDRLWSPDRAQPVWVVMDEAVLRRVVGSRAIMAEQLRHLIQLAEDKHGRLTLQILPYDSPMAVRNVSDFTLFELGAAQSIAAGDGTLGASYFDRAKQVEHLSLIFGGLIASALPPQSSVELIERIAREHENAD